MSMIFLAIRQVENGSRAIEDVESKECVTSEGRPA